MNCRLVCFALAVAVTLVTTGCRSKSCCPPPCCPPPQTCCSASPVAGFAAPAPGPIGGPSCCGH
jgi:hypothetical protein